MFSPLGGITASIQMPTIPMLINAQEVGCELRRNQHLIQMTNLLWM
ncbi:hypothetical protein [Candidatus Nitrotoga sp. AM1P]|nr:hypothetical protein [Candidatus Nitrotoga sp. AM1P]